MGENAICSGPGSPDLAVSSIQEQGLEWDQNQGTACLCVSSEETELAGTKYVQNTSDVPDGFISFDFILTNFSLIIIMFYIN